MIIQFQNIKHASTKWHKNLAIVNIDISLKIEYFEVLDSAHLILE
jgi:hypothetical protein